MSLIARVPAPPAAARSQYSWNQRFEHWERSASETEEDQIVRAADTVRAALGANNWLRAEGVELTPQGSYFNNTNVRNESDMDLALRHPGLYVLLAPGLDWREVQQALGHSDAAWTFADKFDGMRRNIGAALGTRFGAGNIDTSGTKAVRVKNVPNSRAPVDVVPAMQLRFVYANPRPSLLGPRFLVENGIAILSTTGTWTWNYPDQHHANGKAKHARTSRRFKRTVRVCKRLRDELVELGQLRGGQVASFLIESLVYAMPDGLFAPDNRYERVLTVLSEIERSLRDENWRQQAREINGLKMLFHSTQPWTIVDAHAFATKAMTRLAA
jgi:hypothetical protein